MWELLAIVAGVIVLDRIIIKLQSRRCKKGLHRPYVFEDAMICVHCGAKIH